jgi:hypothetical protein
MGVESRSRTNGAHWREFLIVFKERSPQDELEEMAGLRKIDTGLPVNLWLDDSSCFVMLYCRLYAGFALEEKFHAKKA